LIDLSKKNFSNVGISTTPATTTAALGRYHYAPATIRWFSVKAHDDDNDDDDSRWMPVTSLPAMTQKILPRSRVPKETATTPSKKALKVKLLHLQDLHDRKQVEEWYDQVAWQSG
jgi:hypothetical protein